MRKIDTLLESLVNDVIADMQDNKNWLERWNIPHTCRMQNFVTKHLYSGINILLLANSARKRGFNAPYWLTFNQVKKLGGNIKKGEKGTQICVYKVMEIQPEEIDSEVNDEVTTMIVSFKRGFFTVHTVFNIEQTEGIPYELPQELTLNEIERIAQVDEWIRNLGVYVENASVDSACYIPSCDKISIPLPNYFRDKEAYYATLLHEITHWSGATTRLNRSQSADKESKEYCFEELVAELGAMFLCSSFGISIAENRHSEYLKGYLYNLKNDKNLLWKAASQAQKAFDYLQSIASISKEQAVA